MKYPCRFCQTLCGDGLWVSEYRNGMEILTIKCVKCNVAYDLDWLNNKMIWIGFHFFSTEDLIHQYELQMYFYTNQTKLFSSTTKLAPILTVNEVFPDITPDNVDVLIRRLKNLLVFS